MGHVFCNLLIFMGCAWGGGVGHNMIENNGADLGFFASGLGGEIFKSRWQIFGLFWLDFPTFSFPPDTSGQKPL